MRSIMVEEVVKVERYRAIDGTIFKDKEECHKYDKQLHRKNIEYFEEHGRKCQIVPEVSYATPDEYYFVIAVDCEEAATALKQAVNMRGFTEDDWNDEQYKRINDAFATKSDVLVGRFDEYDILDAFYIYGTQAELTARTLDNYNKIFATEKEE